MNKWIKKELEKCKIAKIPEFDDNTTHLVIPKNVKPDKNIIAGQLYLGQEYIIQVEDYIIHPYSGFTLHDNWNNGIVPTDKQMHIKVDQIMGKMIKIQSIGINDKSIWNGWLPIKSIHILEEL